MSAHPDRCPECGSTDRAERGILPFIKPDPVPGEVWQRCVDEWHRAPAHPDRKPGHLYVVRSGEHAADVVFEDHDGRLLPVPAFRDGGEWLIELPDPAAHAALVDEVERLRSFISRQDCGEAALEAVEQINATSYFAERELIAVRLAEAMYAKGREDERNAQ